MTTQNESSNPIANASREEIISALFQNLIVQQTNMAFMFLGRVPHPETGEVVQDLETAKYFIDQIDMLEVKTKGNLDKREESLLKQSLTGLRMAFVEAVDGKSGDTDAIDTPSATTEKIEQAPEAVVPAAESSLAPARPAEDESRKKFSKKY